MNDPEIESICLPNYRVTSSTTKWWIGSILFPPALVGVGFGIGTAIPVAQGDMIGAPLLWCIVGGATLGYLLSIVCTFLSVTRRERWSGLAIVFWLGYSVIVLRAWIR